MNMKNNIRLLAFIPIFLFSCNSNKDLNTSLNKAGTNRAELEKVLLHYSKNHADKEKLAAARFLITNMEDMYYYDGKQLDEYFNIFEMLRKQMAKYKENGCMYYPGIKNIDNTLDTLNQLYGPFSLNNLEVKYDLNNIKASYLINNIDMAFKVWKEQPWGKDLNFEQFCEYILPYRINNERPDFDRLEIYNQFNSLLDSVRETNGDAVAACSRINDVIRYNRWVWTEHLDFLPNFGAKNIIKYRMGVCRECTNMAIYTMRSLGIPVCIDFTPQWPFRSLGHDWNVVLSKEGKNIVFMGVESNPGIPHKANHKKAKVYRNTFAKQPQSLAIIKNDLDNIPSFFENAHFIDVSDEYFDSKDVNISLNKTNKYGDKYAYICVFDNSKWVPIHWGKIKYNNSVTFTKMGREIVYLPVLYNNKSIIPANSPFLLTKDGTIKYLIPDFKKKQQIKLNRKYPVLCSTFHREHMVGGRFQGANTPDFKDAVDLYVIRNLPGMLFESVTINCNKTFRYLRYLSPKNSNGDISELEFYSINDTVTPLKGEIIGTSGSEDNDPNKTKEKAMDGDMSTYFIAPIADYAWVGLDMGIDNEQIIKKIRFLTINDGNNITPGNDYALFYWYDGNWVSAGRQVAKGYELVFDNTPSGALYILHNYTGGKEERIFTYENGKQTWW